MKLKSSILGAAALSFVIIAGCVSNPSAPGAVAISDKDPARIICRNDAPTGSRLPKKVCKSAAEWEAIAQANQEEKRNARRDAIGPGAAGEQIGN